VISNVECYESINGDNREKSYMVIVKLIVKMVGCKWVFTITYGLIGLIDQYKALVKEFTQIYGKLNIIRILLSLVANFDWSLHQFDVKNIFLHGDFEEEIHLDISLGYHHLRYL
jgi:Reverse transcriptase (RNA-dependent DNA polymerase)